MANGSSIDAVAVLSGSIKSDIENLVGHLSMPIGYEDFLGPYNVVPDAEVQTLATENKTMKQNLVIEAIPYYEVSNEQGGETVIIGGK